jgi:hypothetical protein
VPSIRNSSGKSFLLEANILSSGRRYPNSWLTLLLLLTGPRVITSRFSVPRGVALLGETVPPFAGDRTGRCGAYDTPVLKTLNVWPSFPLVVSYGGYPALEGEENIVAALKHSDRFGSISLTGTNLAPRKSLHNLWAVFHFISLPRRNYLGLPPQSRERVLSRASNTEERASTWTAP